jgi:toxin YoeB
MKEAIEQFENLDSRYTDKVIDLIEAIQNNEDRGDPEALKGDLDGCFSRRVNGEDRLVYRFVKDDIQVLACKGHYKHILKTW